MRCFHEESKASHAVFMAAVCGQCHCPAQSSTKGHQAHQGQQSREKDISMHNDKDSSAISQSDINTITSRKAVRITMIIGAIAATILVTLVMMALTRLNGGYVAQSSGGVPIASRFTWPIIIHLCTCLPAIPLGAYVLWRKKGDMLHRQLGKLWAGLMLATALTSLFIGRPGAGIAGSGFSFIHIFSIIVLVSIPLGIWRIRTGDVAGHYRSMQGVYIGLVIAGLFTFVPGRIFGALAFG